MKKIIAVLLGVLFTQVIQAQDPNFHIYLCFGQSNMEGQGTIETQDQTVDNRFRILQSVNCSGKPQNTWRTATPPLCRCNTNLGPADYFGREMVKNLPANIKVGIVHVSIAGCKIELFDKNNYSTYVNSLTASEQWMKNIINEYGGNPYARLVALAKLAQNDGVVKGILLHQGESNTGDAQWPNKVKGVYTNLLADLGLSANNVPLLTGQMVDAAQGGACASMNTIINQLPATIPTAYVISSSGCTDQTDNLHFNSAGYRLLGTRYAQKMLTLLSPSTNTAPTINISAPLSNAVFTALASIAIAANAADADGTISTVQFYQGTTLLGADATAPYSFNWNNVTAGTYAITAKATDNAGAVTTSSAISVVVNTTTIAQTPFNGIPAVIPGIIQAEAYDLGGEGISFHESTTGNSGNSTLRSSDPVDIETTTDGTGGINVGWIVAGEWLEYTVNVTTAGTYSLDVRVASDAARTLHLEMDGINISGTITVPNTGGFQAFQTVTINNINLTGGQKVMRIAMDASYFNINFVQFRLPVTNAGPTVAITAPSNNTAFTAPANITISTNAADTDGTVSSVQFFNGTTLLGSDATSPYSFSWNNVAAGTYSLTTVATDNSGVSTTSAAVSITVSSAPVAVVFQAETACSVEGTLNESLNAGFNGSGYVNTDNVIGSSAVWSVHSVSAQTLTLNIRYAHNTAAGRSMSLSVNNVIQATNIPFPATGNTNWVIVPVQITLAAGTNTIKLVSLTAAGSPYLDELTYQATGISAGSCTVTPNAVPTVSITAPSDNASFTAPAAIVINAAASDADGTVSNVQFFNGTILLGSDAIAPFSFSWNNVTAGTYSLTAKVTDNAGAITTSSVITVVVNAPGPVQTPYTGIPAVIPGTIQVEHYDLGGEGISFHETTSGNSGNSTLRSGDPVDLETTADGGGGINVGWIVAGEWLEYTVNVTTAGTYRLTARVAADAVRTFHVEMDGANISGTITVPNTGAFQTFQTVTINNIVLTAGQKVMRVAMDASYFNLNYITFTQTSGARQGDTEEYSSNVSPNPSDQRFTLSVQENVHSFTIVNNQGIVVQRGGQIMEGDTIEMGEALSNGIYILLIQYSSGRMESRKIRKD